MSSEPTAEDSDVSTEDESTAESEAKSAPALDPAVVELKENIAKLESDIKRKRGELADLKEMADKYSSTGYARQVAMVEDNKRRRGANMADSKSVARASVIKSFIPVLDELDAVAAKYEGNSYAKSLGALRSGFKTSLEELGVTEFTVGTGDAAAGGRVLAVEEEHSEEFASGTVISPLKLGLEISGTVLRPAECVVSLGAEKKEEDAAAQEAPSEEAE